MASCHLTSGLSARAIVFAGVFYLSDAAAQVVRISFEAAQPAGIPISSWTVSSIAAALALAAFWALRSRAGPTLRALIAATIAASVVVATVQANWIREAHAADPNVMNLGTSPAQLTIPSEAIFGMTMSGSSYWVTVVNATGGPVTITDIAIEGNNLALYSGSLGPGQRPRCAVGLYLGTKAICHLVVLAPNHFS